MGFLAPAERIVGRAFADTMRPPPPPDLVAWAEANIVFDERSPFPGPFRIARFPFLAEPLECMSPEHPCREVTVRGSAQLGKSVSIINPTLGAWFEYGPLDALVVNPTGSAAAEWVRNKWLPLRRQAPGLHRIFGPWGGDKTDTIFNQETLARTGSLKIASAGSAADLTGTTRRLVILDDLAKFESTNMGDPESLAESRAAAFEDAKILRMSTAMIKGTCKISRAYERSDARVYAVPCPHCGEFAALTWENFKRSIDPERFQGAHFTCEACGAAIEHKDKERIIAGGRWIPTNPRGDHPGFHLWRAYAPQRDWASIAVEYARIMGWSTLGAVGASTEDLETRAEAETEQTFYNDVLAEPYEQASSAPPWEGIRNRVELAKDGLGRGQVPAWGCILTAGVDCQLDRTEVHLKAFGTNARSFTVDYLVIPHHISETACWETLDGILRQTWRIGQGGRFPLDMLAIDGGTYTEEVWSWAKRHPWTRAIIVKGAATANGPAYALQKFERRKDGKTKRRQKRAYMVNVSMLKAEFYGHLTKEDPLERGWCGFARGMGDEFYRQITAETRVLARNRQGVLESRWNLVEPTRRNEGLDTEVYARTAARRCGWLSLSAEQWDALEAARNAAPAEDQADLFEAAPLAVASPSAEPPPAAAKKNNTAKPDKDWLGGRGRSWS